MTEILLASASRTRQDLLRQVGVAFSVRPARVDEASVRAALLAEGASPRDQADALAELKASVVSARHSDALVIGADQILEHDGVAFGKPATAEALAVQLRHLRGRQHRLFTAVVLCEAGRPVWRHLDEARLTMRDFSDTYLDSYLARNISDLYDTVGGYKIESEGLRLFSQLEGAHSTILGLPLLPLLEYLGNRGFIEA